MARAPFKLLLLLGLFLSLSLAADEQPSDATMTDLMRMRFCAEASVLHPSLARRLMVGRRAICLRKDKGVVIQLGKAGQIFCLKSKWIW